MTEKLFASEADLVAAYCAEVERLNKVVDRTGRQRWTAYHETAGWDLLMVGDDGCQVGIEAKLSLNAKVLEQALPGRWADLDGPDYRAVLVPRADIQGHLGVLARHVGITVITASAWGGRKADIQFDPTLPNERSRHEGHDWFNWCPAKRCKLPDYIPDVSGGKASPVALTEWKVKAIKLMILLDRIGHVTRADMKALEISPSRWTDAYNGFLTPAPFKGGYVRNGRTPDLKAQHPRNWTEIEADIEKWKPKHHGAGLLIGDAA